ncbi:MULTISPECIES: hypothetical protein [unclassified Methylobacterium]|uniref:hypothetical protein n=1 Tax=unclassified Methylobacterium TaxID=2615210 RepID=UPI0011C1FED2|nr:MULTISPECIES: hypothetical protein [unclassified Methylobacterium]QEE37941.1 hypothetical protein FVA80_02150 [Methylobacterium sp. WL1]TXN59354.1 hypothetical protein FV241_02265 [Methylobacterium sp. WL2]
MNFDGLKNVEWGPVAGQLMRIGAPILGTVIGGVPGAIAGDLIGSLAGAIGAPDTTPEAISSTLQTPAGMAAAVQFEADNKEKLESLVEQTKQVQIEQENLSLRAEITAGDRFQRWARPFNMYCVGAVTLSYGFVCVAAAINTIVTKDPTALSQVTGLGASLTTVLIPAGAVAGVTAWQQTKEKLAGVIQHPAPAALVPGKPVKKG